MSVPGLRGKVTAVLRLGKGKQRWHDMLRNLVLARNVFARRGALVYLMVCLGVWLLDEARARDGFVVYILLTITILHGLCSGTSSIL